MIAKRFKTYVFLENLGLSLGKIHCSQGFIAFLLKELGNNVFSQGNFPRKIHCSLGKLYFSPRIFSYSMENLLGIGI
jgi:hypothetical protein